MKPQSFNLTVDKTMNAKEIIKKKADKEKAALHEGMREEMKKLQEAFSGVESSVEFLASNAFTDRLDAFIKLAQESIVKVSALRATARATYEALNAITEE